MTCFVFEGYHVMASPAPHAGVALITALNILEGFNITNQVPRNGTYHHIAEVIKRLFHHYNTQQMVYTK